MSIITSADYPEVRAALDTELNVQVLPDAIIAQSIYHGAAEQDVLDLDPNAESRTDETEIAREKRACIYFCAARLAAAIIRITSISVQARDISYSKPTFDPEQRAAELKAMAEEEIAAILTPSETSPQRPTMFAVASGYRGR
jgi:hypothetical protein